jgi:hypothetical protein
MTGKCQGAEVVLSHNWSLNVLSQTSLTSPTSRINCYIVFLQGVENFSPDEITDGEKYVIDQLAARHPHCVTVRDVFPYSVVNQPVDQGFSSPLWQSAKDSETFGYLLVQMRNLWRFEISADDRYGLVYNLGIARTIIEQMNAAYPIARSDQPINLILLSTSSGTQVALGTTVHLNQWINACLTVISLGGTSERTF